MTHTTTRKAGAILLAMALFATLAVTLSASVRADNEGSNGNGRGNGNGSDNNSDMKMMIAAGVKPEVHITTDGKVIVRGAKVTAVNGATISTQVPYGTFVMPWTVVTSASTEFIRRYGGASGVGEISVGDFLSFSGTLDQTQTAATANADVVKDWSVQKRNATFNGTVSSVNATSSSFVLASNERGTLNVFVSASTTIMLGDNAAAFGDIQAGQRVTVDGLWDTVSSNVQATKVRIAVAKPVVTTLQGTLKTVATTTAPTSITVTVNGTDYAVNVSATTIVLNRIWTSIGLGTLTVGDTVRFYGTVTGTTATATVIRDISR